MNDNPLFQPLSSDLRYKIIEEAFQVLEYVGILCELEEGLDIFADYGCRVDAANNKVYIHRQTVEKALKSAPEEIRLYYRNENLAAVLSGCNVHFNPGSTAIMICDCQDARQRKPLSRDLPILAKLVSQLKNLALQSTSLVPDDVPMEISDSVRLYAALKYCPKPVVTGTFRRESFQVMREMLTAVRGSEQALREKPLAIFDCCPSPPLKWSALTAAAVIDCAKAGIPAEFVSMPLMGATSPVTFVGTLVQHTAEDLSGVVLSQAVQEEAPVIYGGSPAVFDMRYGTTPMGAIETMMLDTAYAQIGRHFGLPTHAYMGLSDSRMPDYQAGLESGMGAVLAASAGINVVSGAGMMDFESCQSLEKLVIDNDICGMALHLRKGIKSYGDDLGFEQIAQWAGTGEFLKAPETRQHFRSEHYFPSKAIERSAGSGDETNDAIARAHQRMKELLNREVEILSEPTLGKIERIMTTEANKFGMNKLEI